MSKLEFHQQLEKECIERFVSPRVGERSGLFFEIIRLTKEINPSFVFLENVPAIRTRGLREVIRAFAEIGWTELSASVTQWFRNK